jgi:hypothetical protein
MTNEVISMATNQRNINKDAPKEIFAERELYFRKGLKILFTGHLDIGVWFPTEKLLIIVDAKFGYLAVEPASGNMQTRCYAVQAKEDYPEAEEIIVALVQPRQPRDEQMSMASYLAADITASKQQILATWEEIQKPDAQRCAGDWCNYCKAKLACDTHNEQMSAIQVFGKATDVSKVDDDDIVKLYMAVKLAESEVFSKAVKDEMKKRILEGRYTGRFELKPGKSRRYITCNSKAFDILVAEVGEEAAKEAVKFSIGTIENVYQDAKTKDGSKMTATEAKEYVGQLFETVIDKTTDAPSIVAVKKGKK